MKAWQLFTAIFVSGACLILLTLALAGCQTVEAGILIPEPTQPGGNDGGEIGAIEVGIEPTPTPAQATYSNANYGFGFDYPVNWMLSEEDHGVVLHQGTTRLGINFRRADESGVHPSFGRTGMGAGDLIYGGKVSFLGQTLPVEVLLYEGRSKAALYNGAGVIETGDLVFLIVLEDLETDYTQVDLSEGMIAEASRIVESFRWLAPAGSGPEAQASELEVFLAAPEVIETGSGAPVDLYFSLQNNSAEPCYLLKWYTPFEGLAGDIFDVRRDGEPVPYQGLLASRGDPAQESYLYLEPGGSLSTNVVLNEGYDFSQPGSYTIRYRAPRISHLAHSEAELATSLEELGPVEIASQEVSLLVSGEQLGMQPPLRLSTDEAGELISAYLLARKPGLLEAPPLALLEVPAAQVWEQLQAQLFVVSEGIIKDEAFLIRQERVVRLGSAAGGKGLTALAVTDLDQDEQAELLFSYNTGLGPGFGAQTQTRVGLYSPAYEGVEYIEADLAYLGLAALKVESPTEVSLRVVESNETSKVLSYLERLGKLRLQNTGTGASLALEVDPQLPEDLRQNILLKD